MIDLLRRRRSVRRFKSEEVSSAHQELLQEALLRSPSSRGLNPWEFVFVDEPGLLEQLSLAKKHGGSFLAGAPLAVVVCADEARADTWIEDCSIASILVQMVAEGLDLGSCWVQIRLRQQADGGRAETHVRRVLELPEGMRVESIIAIGHPEQRPPGHAEKTLERAKIHRNRFGS